jgi:hypothetical protein
VRLLSGEKLKQVGSLVSFSLVKENLTKSSVYLMRPFSVQECSGSSLTILDLTIFSAPATAWRRILVAE